LGADPEVRIKLEELKQLRADVARLHEGLTKIEEKINAPRFWMIGLAGVVGGIQQVDPKNDGAPIPQKHDIRNMIWLMRRQS
jgi:hypothetical protein